MEIPKLTSVVLIAISYCERAGHVSSFVRLFVKPNLLANRAAAISIKEDVWPLLGSFLLGGTQKLQTDIFDTIKHGASRIFLLTF